MMPESAYAFLVFAAVAAVTPGPSNLLVLAAGARAGFWRGLPCLAGVVAGMALLMGLAAAGLGGFVAAQPRLASAMQWGGAALLLWLAWQIASAPPVPPESASEPVGFWRALAFQWVNPKSWIVGVSAAGTYAADGRLGALGLAALFALAAAPSCALWLACGAALQRALARPRAARAFNLAMGAALALSVLLVLR